MQFEWDEKKNTANLQKHGISFEVAMTIFKGFILTRWDRRSYEDEDREISIGMIEGGRVILAVHVDRGEKVRMISARKATKKERKMYYGYYNKKT